MAATSTRRDPERRAQLLEAADRAIATHGAAVRMEDIASEAGVTKPILYRHFGDKGGLYEAVARRAARVLEERLETGLEVAEGPREKLRATIDAFLAAVEDRPETYRFLLHSAAAERPEVSQAVGDFTHELGRRLAGVLREQYARYGFDLGPCRAGRPRPDRLGAPGQRLVAVRSRRGGPSRPASADHRPAGAPAVVRAAVGRRPGRSRGRAMTRERPAVPLRVRIGRRLALNPVFRAIGRVVVPRLDRLLHRLTGGRVHLARLAVPDAGAGRGGAALRSAAPHPAGLRARRRGLPRGRIELGPGVAPGVDAEPAGRRRGRGRDRRPARAGHPAPARGRGARRRVAPADRGVAGLRRLHRACRRGASCACSG